MHLDEGSIAPRQESTRGTTFAQRVAGELRRVEAQYLAEVLEQLDELGAGEDVGTTLVIDVAEYRRAIDGLSQFPHVAEGTQRAEHVTRNSAHWDGYRPGVELQSLGAIQDDDEAILGDICDAIDANVLASNEGGGRGLQEVATAEESPEAETQGSPEGSVQRGRPVERVAYARELYWGQRELGVGAMLLDPTNTTQGRMQQVSTYFGRHGVIEATGEVELTNMHQVRCD